MNSDFNWSGGQYFAAEEEPSMEKMTFKKDWLIGILKKNRVAHRDEFLAAQEGYKKTIIDALEKSLADARKGRLPDLMFHFPVPTDQTKDYDRVINMLENCEEKIIVLGEREYAQYVLDQWQWTDQFKTVTANYLHSR